MRGLGSFIALVVIAAGLGAYVYFVESKRTPGEPEKLQKAFDVQASAIQSLDVKAESGDRTSLEKSADDWTIVEPIKADADGAEVSGLTSNLASLEIQRVVEDKPRDYAQYGLQPPRVQIDFKAGDKTVRTLQIGIKTPTGGDMYARLAGQDRVFLIQAYLDGEFNKKTFDLRDKAILKFAQAQVDSLGISGGGNAVKLAKSGSDWRLASPVSARAEYGAVEGAVGRLENGRMTAIVADHASAGDLRQYGLDKPALTIDVGTGSATATLEIGKAVEGQTDKVYARDLSRPLVFTIDKAIADELEKPAADFRAKDLFQFRPFNATKVTFTRAGKTRVFEKVKGDKGDAWQETAPGRKTPDDTKMTGLLSAFSNLRAESFVDSTRDTGLDKPAVIVSVTYTDGDTTRTERVRFGTSGAAAYGAPDGGPGAARLDATAFADALKALDAVG